LIQPGEQDVMDKLVDRGAVPPAIHIRLPQAKLDLAQHPLIKTRIVHL
jgi:hypothetical protein